jgi:hypothetical protein
MLDDGSIGLVDFGITGQLDGYERTAVFELLLAMRLEHLVPAGEAVEVRLRHPTGGRREKGARNRS